jgi:outer membrane protein assembly factor BamB
MGNDTPQTVTVQVKNDSVDEWPGFAQDEVFFVQPSNPSGAVIEKGRASVTILDNDHSQPGLQFVSAVSYSTGTGTNDGRNILQWRVPPSPAAPTSILIRWNSASVGTDCSAPASDTAFAENQKSLLPGLAGELQSWTHDSIIGPGFVVVPRVYCYSLFAMYPALTAEKVEVVTRTFDTSSGPERWVYSPGHRLGQASVSVMPPTVGPDGVYTVSTDGVVHAMRRGLAPTGGGLWPPTWNPLSLGKPAHNRSPVAPFKGVWRLLIGTEDGEVNVLDARTGTLVWSRSAAFGGTQLMPSFSTGVQATPAALLTDFGGQHDLLLLGTATSSGTTKFFALDPANGDTLDDYDGADAPPGSINNVYGMAVVDYAENRAYFATADASFTLWSLDLGTGSPNLTLTSTTTLPWNPLALGATSGAPVLRNGRIYLGTDTGAAATLHSLRLSDGNLRSYTHGNEQIKGFVWPDRRNQNLYFSTLSQVHAVRDDGLFTPLPWSPMTLNSPSPVLQKPGTDFLYVGDKDGRLVQIDIATGNVRVRVLEPGKQIGAPSLDNNVPAFIHVGSETGAVYAVQVPF